MASSVVSPSAVQQRLRELILAKDYTRRYASYLCSDPQLVAILAADGDALLRDVLAGAGVPMLHRMHVAGFVREAQSISKAAPADMDQVLEHMEDAAPCAVETEGGGGEAAASADEMEDVIGHGGASVDEEQEGVVGSCSSGSVARDAEVARGDEGASEVSSQELVASSDLASSNLASSEVASSDEAIPAPKARLFSSSSFGGEAWSLFRANPDPNPNPTPNPQP